MDFISKFKEFSSREGSVSAFNLSLSVLTLRVWNAAMVKKAVDFLKFVHKINRFERFLDKFRLVDAIVEFLELRQKM